MPSDLSATPYFDRIAVPTADSTSRWARRLVESNCRPNRPLVLVCAAQSSGVGRQGNAFASPPGGLWWTLLWPLVSTEHEQKLGAESLGLRLGWAALRTVDGALFGQSSAAKWKSPNDVLIDGRKVLGILTELVGPVGGRALLVGVGINANNPAISLPAGVREKATSLAEHTGGPVDLRALEESLAESVRSAVAMEALGPQEASWLQSRSVEAAVPTG